MFMDGKNTDKIVNTYDKSSFIRITWLNERSHDFKHYSMGELLEE